LVERGANVEAREAIPVPGSNKMKGSMMTPLHYACLRDHDNVVEYLLEKGADPNSKAIVSNSYL
jgi:hypothetical protein